MKKKKIFIVGLSLIPLLLFSCNVQRQYIHEPRTKGEIQRFTAVRYFGDQGLQAKMLYVPEEGYVKIVFRDGRNLMIPIVTDRKVKAFVTLSSGKQYEFYFYNPKELAGHYFSSFISARNPYLIEPTEILYVRKNWLKNQSEFILKVWVPMDDITYPIEYRYFGQSDA